MAWFFDQSGNLYATGSYQFDPWVVYKITPGGSVSTLGSGLCEPDQIAIDSSGNLYTDNWPGYIEMIAPNGKAAGSNPA